MTNRQRKNKRSLIIFIKNPEKGKVKTRLAQDVGDVKALEIYKKLLTHTRLIALSTDAERHLFYNKEVKVDDGWSTSQFSKKLQSDGDLGNKMKEAFRDVLNYTDHAIIIGSDCAQLNASYIAEAYEKLQTHDVVIGPTYDGGYYLLGMNKLHQSLFQNMAWSTDQVYKDSMNRIQRMGLSVYVMDTLSDIDFIEDWNKYGFFE